MGKIIFCVVVFILCILIILSFSQHKDTVSVRQCTSYVTQSMVSTKRWKKIAKEAISIAEDYKENLSSCIGNLKESTDKLNLCTSQLNK